MKKLLLPLFILTQFVFADPPDWFPSIYEYTMYMNVLITDDNGNNVSSESDMLAAFGEDGTVRGLGVPLSPPFGPYEGEIIWELSIGSNVPVGGNIDFEYYDASSDQVLSISGNSIMFINGNVEGSMMNPFILFTVSGELTCEDQGMWDNNEWITWWFGYDCEASVANWSCHMGITHPNYDHIYDVCPVTCGICDDCLSDMYDCNGNCDGDAVIDECGVCDGFGAIYECGCSDALENYDCDGNCVVEIDCTGTCGGDAVVDECGVCDGDGIVDGTCDCDGNTLDGCGVCGGNADGSDCNNDGVDDVCEDEYDIGFDTGFYDGTQSGDINQDGMTNVVDIILYVNVVLGN